MIQSKLRPNRTEVVWHRGQNKIRAKAEAVFSRDVKLEGSVYVVPTYRFIILLTSAITFISCGLVGKRGEHQVIILLRFECYQQFLDQRNFGEVSTSI